MSVFQKLFKQTFIYGLATVLPRLLGVLLIPLYTSDIGMKTSEFGVYASIFAYIIIGNVLLSYGLETAFFRFINSDIDKRKVKTTALTSITITSILFATLTLIFKDYIALWLDYDPKHIVFSILILTLDALVVIPFVWLRVNENPIKYAIIKILNVGLNLGLNLLFFLVLIPNKNGAWLASAFSVSEKVDYIFFANVIASLFTLILLTPLYKNIGFGIDKKTLNTMLKYAIPVMIAGLAFSINESFDKILLKHLLPKDIADKEVGVYAACYKLGMFITLFVTAFKLGVEPFFFNHAENKNAKENYATITKYFTIAGSAILLFVMVYIDLLKPLLIRNPEYWVALNIVPYILIANLCLGIYHNLSVWYKLTDKTKYGAYISIIGAVITLIINFALIPTISYLGSAIATLCAYGSMMFISYFIGRKHYKVPYDIKRIVSYLTLSILLSLLSFYQFDRNLTIGTLFLFVFLGLIFFLEKNELKRLLKKK